MKDQINEFVDQFEGFHDLDQTEQVIRMVYFHTVSLGRETVNRAELEKLFRLASLPVPKNLAQLLGYLCGKAGKLLGNKGEFSLRREVAKAIEEQLSSFTQTPAPATEPLAAP